MSIPTSIAGPSSRAARCVPAASRWGRSPPVASRAAPRPGRPRLTPRSRGRRGRARGSPAGAGRPRSVAARPRRPRGARRQHPGQRHGLPSSSTSESWTTSSGLGGARPRARPRRRTPPRRARAPSGARCPRPRRGRGRRTVPPGCGPGEPRREGTAAAQATAVPVATGSCAGIAGWVGHRGGSARGSDGGEPTAVDGRRTGFGGAEHREGWCWLSRSPQISVAPAAVHTTLRDYCAMRQEPVVRQSRRCRAAAAHKRQRRH